MKTCKVCLTEKPVEDFYRHRRACKRCVLDRAKEVITPEYRLNAALKTNYGITLDEYNVILENQDGLCAICKEPPTTNRRLYVDHCHTTGQVRGLLCIDCNSGIGRLKDNIDNLKAAIEYLS